MERNGGEQTLGGGGMQARILIVDDEPDMLELLKVIIMERTVHEPVTTNNPVEALELARKGGVDLIIADLKMPELDGAELLEAVRGVDGDVPFIIITAYGTVESALETMRKGVFDFITKPFRKEQILHAIEKALQWSALQKENRMLRERLRGFTA